jgi:hypothetical protein
MCYNPAGKIISFVLPPRAMLLGSLVILTGMVKVANAKC